MKKLFIALVMFALLVPIAYADVSPANMVMVMNCDGIANETLGMQFVDNFSDVNFTTGKIGQACSFQSGNKNYVEFFDNSTLSFNGSTTDIPFTMSFWVNMTSTTSGTVFSKMDRTAVGREEWWVSYSSGSIGVRLSTSTTAFCDWFTNDVVTNNVWHHYFITYNGNKSVFGINFYRDGVPLNVTSFSPGANCAASQFSGLTDTPEEARMGAWQLAGNYGQFLDGKVDMLYVWKGVEYNLSEAIQLYNSNNALLYPFANTVIKQSTYNVTSAYANATEWRINTSHKVRTYDATPTVTFQTNGLSNCSISKYNYNYTQMIANDSNTQCATVYTTSHSCTLPSTQHITKGNQSIYIACQAVNFNESASASGPLHISLDPVTIVQAAYNVSNAYINGTAWTNGNNKTVFMRNRQPIVRYNTSYESNCSMSIYGLNYTAMLTNDSSASCGDNYNTSHICTLPPSLQLVNGPQYLYISCISFGAESIGSTSGGLNISMDKRIIVQVLIQNGTGNMSYPFADVYVINQATNATIYADTVNSTGGVELFVPTSGDYVVYGYNPANSSVEGDIKNHVVVS